MDTANNLISLADFKTYLGISSTMTTYDTTLSNIIDAVSWRFNSETGRQLKARSLTEYYSGDGSELIIANEYPINSNSTNIDIRIDNDRVFSTTDKVYSGDIVIHSTSGEIELDGDWFVSGKKNVKLVYNAGYSTIPYDLQYAAKEFGRFLWNREKNNRVGVRNESVEGASISYAEDMPWNILNVLRNYKDWKRV